MSLVPVDIPRVPFYLSASYSQSNNKPEEYTQPKQVRPFAFPISRLGSFLQLPSPQAHPCAGIRCLSWGWFGPSYLKIPNKLLPARSWPNHCIPLHLRFDICKSRTMIMTSMVKTLQICFWKVLWESHILSIIVVVIIIIIPMKSRHLYELVTHR